MIWPILRSVSSRLAALYTGAFALMVALLCLLTLAITRQALSRQFDDRIAADSAAMVQEYRVEGLPGVTISIHEHDATPGALDFGLQTGDGRPIAGALDRAKSPPGWANIMASGPTDPEGPSRVLTTILPGGDRLLVGDDLRRITAVDGLVVRSFTLAFLGVLVLGAVGGYLLRRDMQRRLASITGAAEAIIDGDLGRRVPVDAGDAELEQLSHTLNRMLDRISGLMENLRQVSSDVAHELRTPLTRLRHKLEQLLANDRPLRTASQPGAENGLHAALDELDGILATFAALLRIAQVEGGARKAAFRSVDLAQITAKVVEAFRPAAEDAGVALTLAAAAPVPLSGDGELLTQMIANLVENAIIHAREGRRALVTCVRQGGEARLSVVDEGPGVPEAERALLFNRFRRLEQSRSSVGVGLGLALVAAVAKLHGGVAELRPAGRGLEARVTLPLTLFSAEPAQRERSSTSTSKLPGSAGGRLAPAAGPKRAVGR